MKRPTYTDRDALLRNVDKCNQTITTFQTAIAKEQETIFELKGYIKELDEWERFKVESGTTDSTPQLIVE